MTKFNSYSMFKTEEKIDIHSKNLTANGTWKIMTDYVLQSISTLE